MAYGPVEYMVVAFPGDANRAGIVPLLGELVESGTIKVLDMAFVHRDAAGEVTVHEVTTESDEVFRAFEALTAEEGGIVSDSDLRDIGERLEPDSAALVVVWEDLWAASFAAAARDAGGVLLELQRLPAEAVEAAVAWQREPHLG